MPYVAAQPETYAGQVVGTGQCVAYVKTSSGAPQTALWQPGGKVKGDATIARGTAIATFDAAGQYTNSTDGTSHAAIYVGQDAVGLQVWDQWMGQPVHLRTIRFQGGGPGTKPVNDGDAFFIIA
jgi:hypothetical protein